MLRNDHGRFLLFTDRTGLPDDDIVRVDGDASGAVWIFTAHGVVRVRGDNFEKVDPLEDGGPGAVPLRFDDRRTPDTVHMGLWRRTPGGIERFAYGHWQTFPTPPGRGATFYKDIRSIYEDALHRVWYSLLSERGRYFCVENGRLQVYEGVPRDAFVSYRDSEGYLWLNDHKGHAARWKKGLETSLAPFESPFFLHVVERSDGWFWLSARHSALFLLRRRAVATLPTFGAPEVGAVLYQARDGKVWAGGLGLQLHRGGALLPFPLTPPLRDMNYLNALGEDRAGHLLYNLRDASHLRQLRGHTQLPEPPYPAVSQAVHHMLLDHLGQQWLATDKGLLLLKPGDPPGAVQTVASEVVNCLLETAPGHLWAGTQTGPIEIAGEAVQPLPLSAHWSYGAVTSMDVDETGSLWIGTVDSGVVHYRNGHFEAFTKADGLPTNFVGTVQAGDPHALWLKTDTGLLRLERSGVEDKLSDRTRGLSLSRFGEEDGLPSALMYPFGNEGSLRLSDGTLWFSTTGGIAALQPWRMPHPETIPRTLVEEHAIDQSGLRSGAPVVMLPGQDSLELHYTALGSEDPAELKFRYRLLGIDSGWVQAGVRRVAYYTRLPPGTYRFEVQAADGDGDTWDTRGASTEVRVLAPWYRTLWFRALALGIVLVALLAILWRRQRRELIDKQQKQAFTRLLLTSQEAERKRIAHDLHDGLGQHLALIANLAQLHRKGDLPAGAKGGLEQIQAEAGVAMDEVEAISYNLRPYQLDRLGLTNAVLSLVRGWRRRPVWRWCARWPILTLLSRRTWRLTSTGLCRSRSATSHATHERHARRSGSSARARICTSSFATTAWFQHHGERRSGWPGAGRHRGAGGATGRDCRDRFERRPGHNCYRSCQPQQGGRFVRARGGTSTCPEGPHVTTVLVADDHPLVRRGLIDALAEDTSLCVVAEAADGVTALEEIRKRQPQVAILDIDMPRLNGLEVVQRMEELKLPVAVILLTLHTGSDLLFAALDLGVHGYILKSSATADIVKGVSRVARGGTFLSSGVEQMLIRRTLIAPSRPAALDDLTELESEVLRGVAAGLTSRELGVNLQLSPRTVENHRTTICSKLGLSGPNALLRYALVRPLGSDRH